MTDTLDFDALLKQVLASDVPMDVLRQMAEQEAQAVHTSLQNPKARIEAMQWSRELLMSEAFNEASAPPDNPTAKDVSIALAEQTGNVYAILLAYASTIEALQEQVTRLEAALVELNTPDAAA